MPVYRVADNPENGQCQEQAQSKAENAESDDRCGCRLAGRGEPSGDKGLGYLQEGRMSGSHDQKDPAYDFDGQCAFRSGIAGDAAVVAQQPELAGGHGDVEPGRGRCVCGVEVGLVKCLAVDRNAVVNIAAGDMIAGHPDDPADVVPRSS